MCRADMLCPWCKRDDDRVVDSRVVEDSRAVRRRRECRSCSRRYTTFERVEDLGLMVVKRDGSRYPYEREKVLAGVRKAIKNRPVDEAAVEALGDRVEDRLRRKGPEVTTSDIGREVLANLAKLDDVAYMRFASVYKDFQEITDFQRELGILQKKEPAGKPSRG